MTDDPKDPDDPNDPPPFRLTDNEWGMTVGPLALSPVRRPEIPWDSYDRNNPSHFLKNHEWGELWKKMTERPIARIANQKSNPWGPEEQKKYQHVQEMVVALLGGKEDWENWQSQNPSIKEYDFQSFDFFHELNLEGATFNKDAIFAEAKFGYGANFFEVKFNNYANFHGAEFNNGIIFTHAAFAKGANFHWAKFKSVTHFNNAKFSKNAIFSRTEFTNWTNFQQITFAEYAGFELTTFAKDADFKHTTFIKEVDFRKAEFCKDADFEQVTFNKNASFYNVKFGEAVNFNRATFAEMTDFRQATFTERAYFQLAKFKDGANFKQATFAEEVVFKQARFQSSGFFNKAEFDGNEIDFSEMILSADSNLILADVKFKHAVPDFRYLNRTPDIRFHNLFVLSPDELIKKDIWQEDDEDRYRKLKELAIGNSNHEYELIFYGYEMNSKLKNFYRIIKKILYNKKWRILCDKKWWKLCKKKIAFNTKWWMDIVPTHFYKWFSNYGQSIGRPISVVMFLWLLPFIYYYIADDGLSWSAFASLWVALTSLSPNSILESIKPIAPVPFFIFDIKLLGYFITKIIASIFWFLFLLGLRNKFKIK